MASESSARRAAKKVGLLARKSKAAISGDNFGGFALIDPYANFVVEGSRHTLTSEEVLAYCAQRNAERRPDLIRARRAARRAGLQMRFLRLGRYFLVGRDTGESVAGEWVGMTIQEVLAFCDKATEAQPA